MTSLDSSSAAAASTRTFDWNSINWSRANYEVRKLQVRIAKATREGNWRKVKSLQWLLTHSHSAKCMAVRRVTENQGKRTPGVDGETWSSPESKSMAISALRRIGYKPKPLRRIYIPKSNGKKRPLGIPTMRDRAMQALYLLALEPVSETTADWNSYGFRRDRSTHDAVGKLFIALSQKGSAQWVLEGDIKGCFDNISHAWILNNVPLDKVILQKWLAAGYVEEGKLFPTNEGTPQGGIISPTLANMVLDGLEDLLGRRFGARKLGGPNSKLAKYSVHFTRYADDFVITGKSKELLENEVKPLVRDFLAERGLTLSEEKTRVTHISEGFDFLGQNVRKYSNGTLLITPSKKNVKTFLTGIRETIYKLRTAKQEDLISVLNPKIQGWANYHQHVVSKETFKSVDYAIWRKLWQWACRRHSNKSSAWIMSRYFHRKGDRQCVFSCNRVLKDGVKQVISLRRASDVSIRRHVKIRGEANPFDEKFEQYFEERLSLKMERNLKDRHKLRYLWKRQKGLCPVCTEKITTVTRWHVHHLVRRVDGGSNSSLNLQLLHPACHRQGHANGKFVYAVPVES